MKMFSFNPRNKMDEKVDARPASKSALLSSSHNRNHVNHFNHRNHSGFSLIELLVVVVIIGVLSVVSYIAIQKTKSHSMNERMQDDLVAIANSLEEWRRDHDGLFPLPDPDTVGNNQNILCYYADATYAHDCKEAAFRQGMIDNTLLGKRYLREVPTDPRTGSRYVYGVTNDAKYFQAAGIYEVSDGKYEARTVENLAKGFEMPSIIRAYDGPNFVVDKDEYLPYSPDQTSLTAKLDNVNGTTVKDRNNNDKSTGDVLFKGDTITTAAGGSVDIYFSDGSITHLDSNSTLELKDMTVDKNDSQSTITKILLRLKAGKIWSKVARLAKASEFRVETSSAIAGVRGTEFGTEVDDLGNIKEVTVLSGEVEVTKDNQDVALVTVPPADPLHPTAPRIPRKATFSDAGGKFAGTVTDATSSSDTSAILGYYQMIPLSTNNRPYILSANSTEIRVRNVNFSANIVSSKLGLSVGARRVRANRLAAYEPSVTPDSAPVFAAAVNGADGEKMLLPQTDPHALTLDPKDLNKPLVLRFEYCDPLPAETVPCTFLDSRLRGNDRSAFTPVPLTVTQETSLTQYDLYPNLFADRPVLKVSAPGFFPLPQSIPAGGIPLPLTAAVANYTGATPVMGYTVIPSAGAVTPPCSVNGTVVSALSEGVCAVTVTASLENNITLTQDVTVKIAPADQRLNLEWPTGAITPPSAPFTPRWSTINVPAGAVFTLTCPDGSVQTNAASGTTPCSSIPPAGAHTWSVVMTLPSSETETRTAGFTVGEAIPTGITAAPAAPTQSAPYPATDTYLTTGSNAALSLGIIGSPGSYNYAWSSPNSEVTFANPSSHASTATITPTAPFTAPMSYRISLEVKSGSALITSINKSVTVRRPFITSIHFSSTPPASVVRETPVLLGQLTATPETPFTSFALGANYCSSSESTAVVYDTAAKDYSYTASGSAASPDTITCRLPSGTEITDATGGKYRVGVAPVTAGVTVTLTGSGTCGDSAIDKPNSQGVDEQCDDGNNISETSCAYGTHTCSPCSADCGTSLSLTGSWCGDGLKNGGINPATQLPNEGCDTGPGNGTDNGCTASCTVAPGWSCTGADGAVSTCIQDAVQITINPSSLTSVNLGSTVTFTSNVACDWSVSGGGTVTNITGTGSATTAYTTRDVTAAEPFSTQSETVTITCAEHAHPANIAAKTLTVNYAPKYTSSTYAYSHAGSNNVNWNVASSTCASLTEGGVIAGTWNLPSSSVLAGTAERIIWCAGSSSSCARMPGSALTYWTGETDGLDNLKAIRINGYSGALTSYDKGASSTNLGFRCVKVP